MSEASIRATPFHARAAEANRLNDWQTRNGWTLAVSYGDAESESLFTRLNAGFADISWRWRLKIEGARAQDFLARLLTRDPARLVPGAALKTLWLNDGGGIRGSGIIARYGRDSFLLIAAAPDPDWIARAAALFDVSVREIGEEEGGLAIVGPFARHIVEAAGLDAALEPLTLRKWFWRGLDVTLSRFGEHGGYEIWCKADDATIVWDRIARAGKVFALKPAGLKAMDVFDLEAGVPRPERDFEPARDGFAATPSPFELGLESLVDDDHAAFNGRAALLAASRATTRVGVELDSDTPASRSALLRGGRVVGRTLASLYSPALRRAIALAIVETASAEPGIELTLPQVGGIVTARTAILPFLPTPDQIPP